MNFYIAQHRKLVRSTSQNVIASDSEAISPYEEIRELNAKAREYDRANNEGGYGYNPYLAEAERTKTITVKANN